MMEPLAPGTEDEPPISLSTSTKQEKERERLLSIKALLPDGSYGNVFEFKYLNGAENWYCNACACPVMGWVFHHETGKRHKMTLGKQLDERFPGVTPENEEPSIQIAPGEPLPPGFEGQVEKVALIQERLDSFTLGPLVALEYLLELRDYDQTKEPTYLCILCDKKGDPRTVLTHLASYKHILQYLKKHFPACYRALAPYMTKQYKRNWQSSLHEIAEAIEKKFGRLKPMPVDADKFENEQVYYLQMIARGRHFSELSGYTFEEFVSKEELTKIHEDELGPNQKKRSPSPPIVANPIKKINKLASNPVTSSMVGQRRRSLSSVSSITSSDLSDYDDQKSKKNYKSSRSPPRYRNRSRSPYSRRYDRRASPPPPRRGDLMPWERSNYRRPRSDFVIDNRSKLKQESKNEKLDEFKKLCKAIDNDMERVLKNHKKNPEKHPQYNDEWKKFWNKRYKELQAENKDVATHDFKPEWIEFWNVRMIELHQDEVKIKKDALKKRLGLEEPAPISFKIQGRKRHEDNRSKSPVPNRPIPPSALPDNDPEVIVIDDRDDESKCSKRSHSPWEEDSMIVKKKDKSRESKPSPNLRSRSRSPRIRSRSPRIRSRSPRIRSRSPRKISRSPKRSHSPPHKSRSPKRSRSPRRRSRSPWRYDRSPRREHDYKKGWERAEYRGRERIRVVSELPWERKGYRDVSDYYKPPSVMRDVTRAPVITPPPAVEEEDDTEINVVAVLRLLTALEDKLGSLGPRIIDLLGKALAMEKNEANSSETLLDNDVNCLLFETVKEMLKGQLLAGLVKSNQEKAFKNAIKKTASLIHIGSERKKEKEKNQPKVDPVKVPGIGTVDKAAIARQIANALVLQGKTDVTQAELEQLINAVVGMAEASRKSNKPITTATFLEEITKASTSKEKTPPPKAESPVSLPDVDSNPKIIGKSTPSMEDLSDSDLQTLLQNFKDLSTEEQHGLINYLKKLEAQEPERVERLRKFVSLDTSKQIEKNEVRKESPKGRESPFSNRVGSLNPENQKKDEEPMISKTTTYIESDEEDYTFEDVAKAASKNVKDQELEKEREIVQETMKFDAAMKEKDYQQSQESIAPVAASIPNLTTLFGINFNNSDLAKTLNSLPVNMASLANIVGSVQNLTKNNPPNNQMKPLVTNFSPMNNEQPKLFPSNLVSYPQKQQHLPQPQVSQIQSQQRSSYNMDSNRGNFPANPYQPLHQQQQQPQTQAGQARPNVGYPNFLTDNRAKVSYPSINTKTNYSGFYEPEQRNDLRFIPGPGAAGTNASTPVPAPVSGIGSDRFMPQSQQQQDQRRGGIPSLVQQQQQQQQMPPKQKFQNQRGNFRW